VTPFDRVVVSVSTSWSRDGLETYFSKVSVSSRSRQNVVRSRSRSRLGLKAKRLGLLGLGPQRLVNKWTFKQIFQFQKLFDFICRQRTSAAQNSSEQLPNVSKEFKHFLDSSSVGLHLFNDDSFATLRPLALQLFSAPCSSAASKRVFSQSGLIMRPIRSHLSPSRLAKLLFLKCNKHAAM